MSIEEKRRATFEASRGPRTDLARFSRGLNSGKYKNPVVEDHWRTWNAALDSVVIDLPSGPATCDMNSTAVCCAIDECRIAIESAGLKVNP